MTPARTATALSTLHATRAWSGSQTQLALVRDARDESTHSSRGLGQKSGKMAFVAQRISGFVAPIGQNSTKKCCVRGARNEFTDSLRQIGQKPGKWHSSRDEFRDVQGWVKNGQIAAQRAHNPGKVKKLVIERAYWPASPNSPPNSSHSFNSSW